MPWELRECMSNSDSLTLGQAMKALCDEGHNFEFQLVRHRRAEHLQNHLSVVALCKPMSNFAEYTPHVCTHSKNDVHLLCCTRDAHMKLAIFTHAHTHTHTHPHTHKPRSLCTHRDRLTHPLVHSPLTHSPIHSLIHLS